MQLSDTSTPAVATGVKRTTRALGGAILGAALALPGVAPPVHAEGAPESGVIGVRYLNYRDWQPGFDRIQVSAPSAYFLVPIAGSWSVSGSGVMDTVSGASPRWHSSISSASHLADFRRAGDLRVTRYESRSSYSLGVAGSTEHDYLSKAVSGQATFSSDDNNTTLAVGFGRAWDVVNPVNEVVSYQHKSTSDMLLGVTQTLTSNDILQVNVTYAMSRGYLNDPYKLVDQRPNERNQAALLLRWNHYFDGPGTTLRLAHRFYSDTYGVRSNTSTVEYVMPGAGGWTFTPLLRYYSQSAANFYYDPVYDPTLGAPYPPGYGNNPTALASADARLSAFGAATVGARIAKDFDETWTADMRVEYYQQKSSWRLFGTGSPGLAPLSAIFVQTGVSKRF